MICLGASGWQRYHMLSTTLFIPRLGLHHICLASTQSYSSTLKGRPQGPSMQGKYTIIYHGPRPINHRGENMGMDATAHLSQVVEDLGGYHQRE